MQRYRLAKLRDRVPMPERGQGVFFTSEKSGESIDPLNPYYARMIADGDLVLVEDEVEEEPKQDKQPARGAASTPSHRPSHPETDGAK